MTGALTDAVKRLDSHDREEAEDASRELAGFGAPALPHLLDALERGLAPSDTAHALVRIAGSDALDALVARLASESEEVRFHVADALGELGDARAVQPLLDGLEREEVVDNLEAYLGALGNLRDARAVAVLMDHVAHWDTGIAAEAVLALGRIGDPRSVDAVRLALDSADFQLREIASETLRSLEGGHAGK